MKISNTTDGYDKENGDCHWLLELLKMSIFDNSIIIEKHFNSKLINKIFTICNTQSIVIWYMFYTISVLIFTSCDIFAACRKCLHRLLARCHRNTKIKKKIKQIQTQATQHGIENVNMSEKCFACQLKTYIDNEYT